MNRRNGMSPIDFETLSISIESGKASFLDRAVEAADDTELFELVN